MRSGSSPNNLHIIVEEMISSKNPTASIRDVDSSQDLKLTILGETEWGDEFGKPSLVAQLTNLEGSQNGSFAPTFLRIWPNGKPITDTPANPRLTEREEIVVEYLSSPR